jgi:hypothetical protein
MNAGAHRAPRRIECERGPNFATGLQLTERRVLRTREESAHYRMTKSLLSAPLRKLHWAVERNHPGEVRLALIPGDVERRRSAVLEARAHANEPGSTSGQEARRPQAAHRKRACTHSPEATAFS